MQSTTPPTTEEKVPVAPKVVAKNPPIEELTKGRYFDRKTQSYRIIKTPPKPEIVAEKEKTEQDGKTEKVKEALRRELIQTFTTKPPETDKKGKLGDNNEPPDQITSGSNQPPGGDPATLIPRVTRLEPERVFFCLIPYTWIKFFNEKTGVTGFWTFMFTYGTYLLSKEKLIMEHEYYGGLSMIVLSYLAVVYVGPSIAEGLDKEVDAVENSFKQVRIDQQKNIEDDIQREKWLQVCMEEQQVLVEAKRENVHLQLEAEYRSRLMTVYQEVKNKLDFQVAYEAIERKYAQDQMVRWTLQKVHESITDELDSQYVDKCLLELDELSQKRQAI